MKVCELFTSIQGESGYAGMVCTFVRLSGCNLRCGYCDTQYSYGEGIGMSIDEIMDHVRRAGINLVEITGGEPLLQEETPVLTGRLLDEGYKVLIETNGSVSISNLDRRAVIILDLKTPGSGMADKMDFSNLDFVKPSDSIKFVLTSRSDYDWARQIVSLNRLEDRCEVLFSPALGMLEPSDLARWMTEDRLRVRLNIQIHKYIFGPDQRGV